MRNGKLILCVLVFGLIATVAWVMNDSRGEVAGVIVERAGPETAVPLATSAEETPEPVAAEEPSSTIEAAGRTEVATSDVEDGLAVFRGRCVDESGQPVEGVEVKVRGFRANSRRMDAYQQEHGEVVYEDPEASKTGADGRFEVTIDPPPPYQFTLRLSRMGLVGAYGRWSAIARGSVHDFDDVVLKLGVAVRGRIVDDRGAPVSPPSERIRIELRGDVRSVILAAGLVSTNSSWGYLQPDGSFELRERLAPGKWTVSLRELEQLTESVTIDASTSSIQIVVIRPEDGPSIRGVVVDTKGQPVRGASISPVGRSGGSFTSTKRHGSFELKKKPEDDPAADFALSVRGRGFERLRSKAVHNWGDHGVRLIVRRGVGLEVRVVSAVDDEPIEDFGVRVMRASRMGSMGRRVQGGWKHEGGILLLEGIARAEHRVIVEPAASTGLVPASQAVELEGDGVTPLLFRLSPSIEQVVRVRRSDGTPVLGTKVELIDAMGADIRPDSFIRDFKSNRSSSAEVGLLIARGTTADDGAVTISGGADLEYAIRCVGAHSPVVRSKVVLSGEPIEITVPLGATMRITASPVAVLNHWRELAGLPASGEVKGHNRSDLPKVFLQQNSEAVRERFPPTSDDDVPFDEQGRVELSGVPAGNWNVVASHKVRNEAYSSTKSVVIRRGLVLGDGQTVDIEWDLSPHVPGVLKGTVLLDDKPHEGQFMLSRQLEEVLPGGQRAQDYVYAQANAAGQFETKLVAGLWKVVITVIINEQNWVQLPGQSVSVVAHQLSEVTLHASLVSRRIRILDPKGEPVSGVTLSLIGGGSLRSFVQEGPTDAAGEAVLHGAPGVCSAKVLVRSLRTAETVREWRRKKLEQSGNDWSAVQSAMEAMRVTLPDVTLTIGGDTEPLVIRLPEEWDR